MLNLTHQSQTRLVIIPYLSMCSAPKPQSMYLFSVEVWIFIAFFKIGILLLLLSLLFDVYEEEREEEDEGL